MTNVRICAYCGIAYDKTVGGRTKYCSDTCARGSVRDRNRDRWRDSKGLSAEEVRCEKCGKTISGRRIGSKFCSKECRSKAVYESRRERHGHTPMREHKEKLARQKAETKKRIEKESAERRKNRRRLIICSECGEIAEAYSPGQKTCTPECGKARRNRMARERKDKRLNGFNIVDKDISLKTLYKRDKGTCYICGGKCDFKDHIRDGSNFTSGPNYPSIDHITPLSRGGKHSWDNVKLAHHLCNSKKSDILPSELGLNVKINDAYALARKVSPRKKQVRQSTKDGRLIAIYESTIEASKQTGLKAKGIQNCARGERPSQGGYLWSY